MNKKSTAHILFYAFNTSTILPIAPNNLLAMIFLARVYIQNLCFEQNKNE